MITFNIKKQVHTGHNVTTTFNVEVRHRAHRFFLPEGFGNYDVNSALISVATDTGADRWTHDGIWRLDGPGQLQTEMREYPTLLQALENGVHKEAGFIAAYLAETPVLTFAETDNDSKSTLETLLTGVGLYAIRRVNSEYTHVALVPDPEVSFGRIACRDEHPLHKVYQYESLDDSTHPATPTLEQSLVLLIRRRAAPWIAKALEAEISRMLVEVGE